jgi:hypothetical protein
VKTLIHDIVHHKLLMLRGLLVGLVAAIITGKFIVLPLMGVLLPGGLVEGGSFSWHLFLTRWAPLHGAHGAFVGWLIARFHREFRAAALAVFVVFGLPAVLPLLFSLALKQSPMFFPIFAQSFWPVVCLVASGLLLVSSTTERDGQLRAPAHSR